MMVCLQFEFGHDHYLYLAVAHEKGDPSVIAGRGDAIPAPT